jgi:hypothetical protein
MGGLMSIEAVASLKPNHLYWGIPGGNEFDAMTYNKDALRAELVEIANQHSFQHGPKIVDAILKRFDVKHKPLKERK